jgi:tRNA U34 5-carboxymethylaminomethyl modifying GTPase MnmE/TrmE
MRGAIPVIRVSGARKIGAIQRLPMKQNPSEDNQKYGIVERENAQASAPVKPPEIAAKPGFFLC